MPDKNFSTEDAQRAHRVALLKAQRAAVLANEHFDNAENKAAGTREAKLAKIDSELSNLNAK